MTQSIPLPDSRVVVAGAVDIDESPSGITPRRMSNRYRHELPMEVEMLANSPSGIRLRMRTDSPTLGLDVMPMHIKLGDVEPRYSVFDAMVNGSIVASATTTAGNLLLVDTLNNSFSLEHGEPGAVSFEVGPGMKDVDVWLPSCSTVELRGLTLDDGAVLETPPDDTRPRWVHHGSSISHCMEAHSGSQIWPGVAARIGNVNLTNLGLAGQCHLDQFAARTMRDLPAELISLKCGINVVNGDTLRFRTFPSALHGFIDTVRDGHPDTPFLVVSPILCPTHEDAPGPTINDGVSIASGGSAVAVAQGALTLQQIRGMIAAVVKSHRDAGDKNLHYLDGRELFNEDDLDDLPDGLHPNGDGYVRMGERFAAVAFADGGALAI